MRVWGDHISFIRFLSGDRLAVIGVVSYLFAFRHFAVKKFDFSLNVWNEEFMGLDFALIESWECPIIVFMLVTIVFCLSLRRCLLLSFLLFGL